MEWHQPMRETSDSHFLGGNVTWGAAAPWSNKDWQTLEGSPESVLFDHALDGLAIDSGFPGGPAHMAFVALE
jgi:hypothetical protein